MVGLALFSSAPTRSSTVPSLIPAVFRVRLTITASPARSCSRGATASFQSGTSSAGGPGSATSTTPAFSTHQPGAVPRGLGIACAEGIRVACLRLRSDMG